jgi:hypothetical protein
MTAFEGQEIPASRTVTGNSLLVQVDDDRVSERFDSLIHAGMPHHVQLSAGRSAETLQRAMVLTCSFLS